MTDFTILLNWLQHNLIGQEVSVEFIREYNKEMDEYLFSGQIIGLKVESLIYVQTRHCNQHSILINNQIQLYLETTEIDKSDPSSLKLYSGGKNTVNLVKDDDEWL